MTFVTSHIELDVAHTKFNAHFLSRLIDDDPLRLPLLVAAGAAALGAFADHLTECWDSGPLARPTVSGYQRLTS